VIKYIADVDLLDINTHECLDTCEMSIEVPMELDKTQQFACMVHMNELDHDDLTCWSVKNMRQA